MGPRSEPCGTPHLSQVKWSSWSREEGVWKIKRKANVSPSYKPFSPWWTNVKPPLIKTCSLFSGDDQADIRAKTHNTQTHTTFLGFVCVCVFKSCLQPLTHQDLAASNPANQNTEHWDLAPLPPLPLLSWSWRPGGPDLWARQVADYK